jgi:NAD(P)-dependent dehydrogenase (short-subunit alcohol dehydrogenase family)
MVSALITGSTAAIGLAIATSLARENARVIVTGRTQIGEVKAATGGDAVGFAGDLGNAAAAEELVRRHPGIEILVNNLGIFEPKPFEEIPDSEWMRLFEVNVLSGVRLVRLCLPAMRRANWGRIIFISSESALQIPADRFVRYLHVLVGWELLLQPAGDLLRRPLQRELPRHAPS